MQALIEIQITPHSNLDYWIFLESLQFHEFQAVKKIIYISFWMKEHAYKDFLDGRTDRRITYFETPIRPPHRRGKDEWHHSHAIKITRIGEDDQKEVLNFMLDHRVIK